MAGLTTFFRKSRDFLGHARTASLLAVMLFAFLGQNAQAAGYLKIGDIKGESTDAHAPGAALELNFEIEDIGEVQEVRFEPDILQVRGFEQGRGTLMVSAMLSPDVSPGEVEVTCVCVHLIANDDGDETEEEASTTFQLVVSGGSPELRGFEITEVEGSFMVLPDGSPAPDQDPVVLVAELTGSFPDGSDQPSLEVFAGRTELQASVEFSMESDRQVARVEVRGWNPPKGGEIPDELKLRCVVEMNGTRLEDSASCPVVIMESEKQLLKAVVNPLKDGVNGDVDEDGFEWDNDTVEFDLLIGREFGVEGAEVSVEAMVSPEFKDSPFSGMELEAEASDVELDKRQHKSVVRCTFPPVESSDGRNWQYRSIPIILIAGIGDAEARIPVDVPFTIGETDPEAILIGLLLPAVQKVRAAETTDFGLTIQFSGENLTEEFMEGITVEDLVIDEREMTTGADWDYRLSSSADGFTGHVTVLKIAAGGGTEDWWLETCGGEKKSSIVCSCVVTDANGQSQELETTVEIEWPEAIPPAITAMQVSAPEQVQFNDELKAICPVGLKISTENFTQALLDGLIFSVESTGPFSASFEPDRSSIPSIDDLSNGVIELRGTLVFEAEEEQEIIIVEEEPMGASIQVEVGDLRASGDTGPIRWMAPEGMTERMNKAELIEAIAKDVDTDALADDNSGEFEVEWSLVGTNLGNLSSGELDLRCVIEGQEAESSGDVELVIDDEENATASRTFIFPHMLEPSGVDRDGAGSFDTTLFLIYSSADGSSSEFTHEAKIMGKMGNHPNLSFTGGVTVATGDVNGDGMADIVVGANVGLAHVRVVDADSFSVSLELAGEEVEPDDIQIEEVADGDFKLSVFVFEPQEIAAAAARTGRNPQTGKEIKIAAKLSVGYEGDNAAEPISSEFDVDMVLPESDPSEEVDYFYFDDVVIDGTIITATTFDIEIVCSEGMCVMGDGSVVPVSDVSDEALAARFGDAGPTWGFDMEYDGRSFNHEVSACPMDRPYRCTVSLSGEGSDATEVSRDARSTGFLECFLTQYCVVSPRDAASGMATGKRDAASGMASGKRQHKPLTITKEVDKATPLLANVVPGDGSISGEGDQARMTLELLLEGENLDMVTPVVSMLYDGEDNDCDDVIDDLKWDGGTVQIGLLLPAVQKVREAAARNGGASPPAVFTVDLLLPDGSSAATGRCEIDFVEVAGGGDWLDDDSDDDGILTGFDGFFFEDVEIQDATWESGELVLTMAFGGPMCRMGDGSVMPISDISSEDMDILCPDGSFTFGADGEIGDLTFTGEEVVPVGQVFIKTFRCPSDESSELLLRDVGFLECFLTQYSIISPRDAASGLPTGKRDAASGLPTGKRQHKPLTITKELDKSTPLLYQGLRFASIDASGFEFDGEGYSGVCVVSEPIAVYADGNEKPVSSLSDVENQALFGDGSIPVFVELEFPDGQVCSGEGELSQGDDSVSCSMSYIKFDGVDGESSRGSDNQIEILSWSWGVVSPRDAASGMATGKRDAASGMATGRRTYEPIVIRKRIDKSTPLLMEASSGNGHVTVLKIAPPDGGGTGEGDLIFEFALRGRYLDKATPLLMVTDPNTGDEYEAQLEFSTFSDELIEGTASVRVDKITFRQEFGPNQGNRNERSAGGGEYFEAWPCKWKGFTIDGNGSSSGNDAATDDLSMTLNFEKFQLAEGAIAGNPLQDGLYEEWIYAIGFSSMDLPEFTANGSSLTGMCVCSDPYILLEDGTLVPLSDLDNDALGALFGDGSVKIMVEMELPNGQVMTGEGELSSGDESISVPVSLIDFTGLEDSILESGEIEILSWSWGESSVAPRDAATGLPTGKRQHSRAADGGGLSTGRRQHGRDAASGLATGKRQHKPVTITKPIDKSSPLLMNLRRGGGNGAEQGVDTGGAAGLLTSGDADDRPTEEVAFTYGKITWTWEDGGITAEDDWETPVAIAGPGGGTMAEDDWETPVALNIEIIFEDENITPEMLEGVMVNFTSDTPGFKDSSAPLENVQKDQQRSRGDTTLGDVVVVRELDKSSTKLQLSGSLTLSGGELQRGGLYEEVGIKPIRLELAIAAPGGGGGSSSGGEVPTEDISLNFEEIKVTYELASSPEADSSGGAMYVSCWARFSGQGGGNDYPYGRIIHGSGASVQARLDDGTEVPATIEDLKDSGGTDEILIGLLLPAVQKVREAAARSESLTVEIRWMAPAGTDGSSSRWDPIVIDLNGDGGVRGSDKQGDPNANRYDFGNDDGMSSGGNGGGLEGVELLDAEIQNQRISGDSSTFDLVVNHEEQYSVDSFFDITYRLEFTDGSSYPGVIEYQDGDDPVTRKRPGRGMQGGGDDLVLRKRPGRIKCADVTLERSRMSQQPDGSLAIIAVLIGLVDGGQEIRKDLTINLRDSGGDGETIVVKVGHADLGSAAGLGDEGGVMAEDDWETPVAGVAGDDGGGIEAEDDWETPRVIAGPPGSGLENMSIVSADYAGFQVPDGDGDASLAEIVINHEEQFNVDSFFDITYRLEFSDGSSSSGMTEYQDGEDIILRKRPGRTKYSNITLKRGMLSENPDGTMSIIAILIGLMEGGQEIRKDITIDLRGDDNEAAYRYYQKRKFNEELLDQRKQEVDSVDNSGGSSSTSGADSQDYNSSRSNNTNGETDQGGDGNGSGGTRIHVIPDVVRTPTPPGPVPVPYPSMGGGGSSSEGIIFTVQISGAGTGSDVDSAWETCSGGALNIEVADSSVGTDQSHMTTPGHKYVDLRLTPADSISKDRKQMLEWYKAMQEKGMEMQGELHLRMTDGTELSCPLTLLLSDSGEGSGGDKGAASQDYNSSRSNNIKGGIDNGDGTGGGENDGEGSDSPPAEGGDYNSSRSNKTHGISLGGNGDGEADGSMTITVLSEEQVQIDSFFDIFFEVETSGLPSGRREHDHIGNYNFRVEIDGVDAGYFKGVDGLNAELDALDDDSDGDSIDTEDMDESAMRTRRRVEVLKSNKQGDPNKSMVSGGVSMDGVVLDKSASSSMVLWDWVKQTYDGEDVRACPEISGTIFVGIEGSEEELALPFMVEPLTGNSRATDHNSSRSNKTSSVAAPQGGGDGDDDNDNTGRMKEAEVEEEEDKVDDHFREVEEGFGNDLDNGNLNQNPLATGGAENGASSQHDDGAIRDFSWKQVGGPYKGGINVAVGDVNGVTSYLVPQPEDDELAAAILMRIRKRPDLLTQDWDELIDDAMAALGNNPLYEGNSNTGQNPMYEAEGVSGGGGGAAATGEGVIHRDIAARNILAMNADAYLVDSAGQGIDNLLGLPDGTCVARDFKNWKKNFGIVDSPGSSSSADGESGLEGVTIYLDVNLNVSGDDYGRYRVNFPVASRLLEEEGIWFFLPEIDDEVLVGFEQGDPDQPIIVGRLINGDDAPPNGIPVGTNPVDVDLSLSLTERERQIGEGAFGRVFLGAAYDPDTMELALIISNDEELESSRYRTISNAVWASHDAAMSSVRNMK